MLLPWVHWETPTPALCSCAVTHRAPPACPWLCCLSRASTLQAASPSSNTGEKEALTTDPGNSWNSKKVFQTAPWPKLSLHINIDIYFSPIKLYCPSALSYSMCTAGYCLLCSFHFGDKTIPFRNDTQLMNVYWQWIFICLYEYLLMNAAIDSWSLVTYRGSVTVPCLGLKGTRPCTFPVWGWKASAHHGTEYSQGWKTYIGGIFFIFLFHEVLQKLRRESSSDKQKFKMSPVKLVFEENIYTAAESSYSADKPRQSYNNGEGFMSAL